MHILYTTTSYPPAIGGAQHYLHLLNQSMLNHNHSSRVVTFWTENRYDWLLGTTLKVATNHSFSTIDGIEVQRIGIPSKIKLEMLPWILTYYLQPKISQRRIGVLLAELLREDNNDIQLVHNTRIGVSNISYASLHLSNVLDVPFVVTAFHHPRWSHPYYRFYAEIYQQSDAVVALTNAEKKSLVELGLDDDKVSVIGMGPSLPSQNVTGKFRDTYNVSEYMVLYLGQKYKYKGFDLLLESAELVWEEFPDTTFVFIGPRTSYSKTRFQRIDDPRIIELGIVSEQIKTDAIAASSMLCLPSNQESFGAVFLEAWSLNVPVIGRDIPAVAEVIDHNLDGLLTNGQVSNLAEQIKRLLSSPSLRADMGARGREKTSTKYNWSVIQQKTEQLYLSLL